MLETLMEIFPEAPVYTLLHDKVLTGGKFESRVAKTSFLDIPLVRKNHRPFIPLMPLAANLIRIPKEYDVVISSSAGFGKGISVPPYVFHIAYCHTPLRYAWEPGYVRNMVKMPGAALFAKPLLAYLRKWDYGTGQKPDLLLANSDFIAQKIKSYYGRKADVIYPPVDTSVFYPEPKTEKKYFLAIGRLMHYKKFDLIIDAFKQLTEPLLIVGAGPEEVSLKARAAGAPNIEFAPFEYNASELRRIYNRARALIFPQVEDFGLVAAEALASGTPVIAYNAGGAKEIITEKTGMFFNEQSQEALIKSINSFIAAEKTYSSIYIAQSAARFSKDSFKQKLALVIASKVTKFSPKA